MDIAAAPDRLAALFELLIAVGLVWWAVARVRRPAAHPPKPKGKARTGTAALLGLRIVWAAAAVLAPVAAWVGTGALFLAGAVFAADALWWFATERFLIPIPA